MDNFNNQQLDGKPDGTYRPEHPDLIRKGLLGSTLNVRGARRTNELQRIAVEEGRLKLPVLFAFDVIHGYRTVFPTPLAEPCSWDPKTVESARPASQPLRLLLLECAGSSLLWWTSRVTRAPALA